jgi:ABC-2 type transport system ATP-binding protein
MQNFTNEINSYIAHQDNLLVKRRLLDASLETKDIQIIDETILWSKKLNDANTATETANILKNCESILNKIDQNLSSKIVPSPIVLLKASVLQKKYTGSNFSLKPVDITIQSGDVIGIVGENGNGKTTLLRCLAGQLLPTAGNITYDSITNFHEMYNVKHKVAFIPQRIPKWYGLLKDNLHFSASLSGIHGAENERMVEFMIERLNLGKYAHLTWDTISSGYRTRFEIARILLQKPNLLILDEPLANLDINAQQTFLSDIRFLVKSASLQLGVILSSQQLYEVEKTADQVLLIKDGNCFWNADLITNSIDTKEVVELETDANRDELSMHLPADVSIAYNGNFFTLTGSFIIHELLTSLASKGFSVKYFRNITKSTKRYF